MAVGYTNGGPPGLVDTLSSGTWSDTTLLAPAGSTGFRLQGVSCSAVGSCEAVGYATKSSTVDQPVVETLTSGSWSASTPTLPVGALSGALYGVSCPASGTCVAVGTVTDSSDQALPLVETLAGGAWSPTALSAQPSGSVLASVSCPVSGTCEAVGSSLGSVVESLAGGTWTASTLPIPTGETFFQLFGVSCPSIGTCVADGLDGTGNEAQGLVAEDLSEGTWEESNLPAVNSPSASITGVSCLSASTCTAIGSYQGATGATGFMDERLSGTTWTGGVLPTPPGGLGGTLTSVSCPSSTWCEAVGYSEDSSGFDVSAAETLSAGKWTAQLVPEPPGINSGIRGLTGAGLGGVSCPAVGICVAVGGFYDVDTRSNDPIVEELSSGSWTFTVPTSDVAVDAYLSAVSCPVVGWCEAVGGDGFDSSQALAETGWGADWSGSEPPLPVESGATGLQALSCPGVDACVATSYVYQSTEDQFISDTLSRGVWTDSSPALQTGPFDLGEAVGCVSTTSCVAGGDFGEGTSFDAEILRPAGWNAQPVDLPGQTEYGGLGGVSCVQSGVCTATGSEDPVAGGENPIAVQFQIPAPGTATTTRITGVPENVESGQAVTYGAAVTPRPDGGDVTFIDQTSGQTLCAARVLSDGTAVCATTAGDTGLHQILAAYSGDSNFTPSDGSAAENVVAPPCPTGVNHQAAGEPWAVAATVVDIDGRSCAGYWVVTRSGGVTSIGAAPWLGDMSGVRLNAPMVGIAAAPHGGYWLLGADGGIFTFGDAHFYGSTGNLHLDKPVVGMASTADGDGYWLVASDGGIFTFGHAPFYGSTGNLHLNKPVVGMAPALGGAGYWLVAADGGIFSFGDSPFYGSLGNITLAAPIVGMSPQPDGHGYRLVGSDGGVFDFGNAAYYGSLPGDHVNNPQVTTIASSVDGNGYYLVNGNGQLWAFGDAPYLGNA